MKQRKIINDYSTYYIDMIYIYICITGVRLVYFFVFDGTNEEC